MLEVSPSATIVPLEGTASVTLEFVWNAAEGSTVTGKANPHVPFALWVSMPPVQVLAIVPCANQERTQSRLGPGYALHVSLENLPTPLVCPPVSTAHLAERHKIKALTYVVTVTLVLLHNKLGRDFAYFVRWVTAKMSRSPPRASYALQEHMPTKPDWQFVPHVRLASLRMPSTHWIIVFRVLRVNTLRT